jgi:hypothetical protein
MLFAFQHFWRLGLGGPTLSSAGAPAAVLLIFAVERLEYQQLCSMQLVGAWLWAPCCWPSGVGSLRCSLGCLLFAFGFLAVLSVFCLFAFGWAGAVGPAPSFAVICSLLALCQLQPTATSPSFCYQLSCFEVSGLPGWSPAVLPDYALEMGRARPCSCMLPGHQACSLMGRLIELYARAVALSGSPSVLLWAGSAWLLVVWLLVVGVWSARSLFRCSTGFLLAWTVYWCCRHGCCCFRRPLLGPCEANLC